VLVANLLRMDDAKGGWKAATPPCGASTCTPPPWSAGWPRPSGPWSSATASSPTLARPGRLGHWAIAGVPDAVMEAHFKRAAEIDAEMARTGHDSYRARGIAARTTRDPKRHASIGELMPRWTAEIEHVGWSIEAIAAAIEREALEYQRPRPELTNIELRNIANLALADGSPLVARKVFAKHEVIVAVAPALYGRDSSELARAVSRTLADPETVPLLGVAGASERAYTTAITIDREESIARNVESQVGRTGAPAVVAEVAEAAMARAERSLGRSLTAGQWMRRR